MNRQPLYRQFRFLHRGDDGKLYWESRGRMPGDSRVQVVCCSAEWYFGR